MIPLHGIIPTRTRPAAVLSIAAVQSVAFAVAWVWGHGSVIPAGDADPGAATSAAAPIAWSLLVQPGGPLPAANVFALWLFGGTVEDRLGHGRFVLLWLASGLAAALCQVAVTPAPGPLLGATGAAAGVIAATLVLYPRARILTATPVLIGIELTDLPAWLYAVVWGSVLVASTVTLALAGTAAVVVTGLSVGAVGARLLYRRERMAVEWWGR